MRNPVLAVVVVFLLSAAPQIVASPVNSCIAAVSPQEIALEALQNVTSPKHSATDTELEDAVKNALVDQRAKNQLYLTPDRLSLTESAKEKINDDIEKYQALILMRDSEASSMIEIVRSNRTQLGELEANIAIQQLNIAENKKSITEYRNYPGFNGINTAVNHLYDEGQISAQSFTLNLYPKVKRVFPASSGLDSNTAAMQNREYYRDQKSYIEASGLTGPQVKELKRDLRKTVKFYSVAKSSPIAAVYHPKFYNRLLDKIDRIKSNIASISAKVTLSGKKAAKLNPIIVTTNGIEMVRVRVSRSFRDKVLTLTNFWNAQNELNRRNNEHNNELEQLIAERDRIEAELDMNLAYSARLSAEVKIESKYYELFLSGPQTDGSVLNTVLSIATAISKDTGEKKEVLIKELIGSMAIHSENLAGLILAEIYASYPDRFDRLAEVYGESSDFRKTREVDELKAQLIATHADLDSERQRGIVSDQTIASVTKQNEELLAQLKDKEKPIRSFIKRHKSWFIAGGFSLVGVYVLSYWWWYDKLPGQI